VVSIAIDKKKKRPSSITPPGGDSTTNAEFILAKLDRELTSPIKASARASMDGKGVLQAEFETARKAKEDERSSKADAIDWGTLKSMVTFRIYTDSCVLDFWGNVMNDYEQFAREQPKRLAQAIEAGIPAALRGMVWQLM
jgi:ecotropic viral integration site 5 protein